MIRLRDVGRGYGMLALVPLAWFVPLRRWNRVCRILGAAIGWFRERTGSPWSDTVARTFGARPMPVRPAVVRGRVMAQYLESIFQALRGDRTGGSRPVIRLEARERLDEALARGHGCILWVHRFRPLIHFLALYEAGYTVWRPSNAAHGYFRHSWVGRRWLNPVQVQIESPYSNRIVADPSGFAHLRGLRERLDSNAVVSMYCDSIARGRNVEAPFLDARLSFGTQAPSLALESGAALLPVFPLCEAPGVFRVVIETPIVLDHAAGRRRAVEGAVLQLAAGLEPYVRRYPDQWHDWWRVQV
jgi:lauroyl/myristoyl acyltransferase